jgi:very-short-patch-repair endonuclease/predicted transcriptional regulator of viral defense system
MAIEIPEQLRELARAQAGVVTNRQAVAAGLTKAALAWQLQSARWQQPYRGVYVLSSGPPTREAVLWAAVLRGGRGAMLSHQSAAELGHLIDRPRGALHLTVPADRRIRPVPGLVIHTSTHTEQVRHPSLRPPRTRIEHTVLDLAAQADTFDDALGWVTRACGRRLTTQDRLRAAMAARGRLRWRELLARVLADPVGGLHSVLELRYYRDVERAHCLPRACRQVRVIRDRRTEYRDAFYSRYRVVVELDGRLAHRDEARWRDIRRDNAAAADGGITLRYGWSDVTAHPCRTAGELARVLVRRGWVGRPKLCSADCCVVSGWL